MNMNMKYTLSNQDLSLFPKLFKGMSGIYLWTNQANGKRYIGSSFNLERRVSEYLNPTRLIRELKRGDSIIYQAMIKYGYLEFSFEVLEVIELDLNLSDREKESVLLSREQHYLNEIDPEYNILKLAGTNYGHKMSPEARAKISAGKLGKPSHRKGATITNESRLLIKANSLKSKRVYVYSIDNVLISSFSSISDCAISLGISRHRIGRALDLDKQVEGKYIFKSI